MGWRPAATAVAKPRPTSATHKASAVSRTVPAGSAGRMAVAPAAPVAVAQRTRPAMTMGSALPPAARRTARTAAVTHKASASSDSPARLVAGTARSARRVQAGRPASTTACAAMWPVPAPLTWRRVGRIVTARATRMTSAVATSPPTAPRSAAARSSNAASHATAMRTVNRGVSAFPARAVRLRTGCAWRCAPTDEQGVYSGVLIGAVGPGRLSGQCQGVVSMRGGSHPIGCTRVAPSWLPRRCKLRFSMFWLLHFSARGYGRGAMTRLGRHDGRNSL
jgi:hypothetical protein